MIFSFFWSDVTDKVTAAAQRPVAEDAGVACTERCTADDLAKKNARILRILVNVPEA